MIHDKVSRLFEINRSLTQSLDVEDVLIKLVKAAFDLIDNADTVILYKLKEDGLIHYSHGVGVNEKAMQHVKFRPGESITGKVFLSKKGVVCSGNAMKEHMTSMSKINFDYFLKGVNHREIKSGMVVPLLYKNDCIGVLVVDNFNENNVQFSEDEINIMEIAADQAAIAIMNSMLFQEVKSKNEALTYSLEVQRKFTKILLEGKGSPAILDMISRMLKITVTYSDTILDHANYYPIISSREVFGYLVLNKPLKSLSHIQKAALEHAATAMALEFFKQHTLFEKEMHGREELFQEILNGSRTESTKKMQEKLDLYDHSKITCMIAECKNGMIWNSNAVFQKEKLIRSIEQILIKYGFTPFVFTKTFQIVILLTDIENEKYRKLVKEILNEAGLNNRMVIGIGRAVILPEIVDSYNEASEAAAFCKSTKNKEFAAYSELGVERLWLNTDQYLLKKFVHDKIGLLLKMDAEYVATMKAFIHYNKSHKKTAASLHIHPNTLSYRLKKIEKQLGIDFQRKEDWINVVLAFQMDDYIKA